MFSHEFGEPPVLFTPLNDRCCGSAVNDSPDLAMIAAPGGGPPDFDAAAARLLLNRCQNPPSLQPGEPGLRALWAIEHVHHFTTNKEAWEYYGAGKQSYGRIVGPAPPRLRVLQSWRTTLPLTSDA